MNDRNFQLILSAFELSWPGYRRVKKGVKKRLTRHMRDCGCQDVADYLEFLQKNRAELIMAKRLLTVSISRFYRDPDMWQALDDCLASRWARPASAAESRPFRAWSAGCSCGEEAYSLKILWMHLERRLGEFAPLVTWASDTNPRVLEKGREGIYPRSSVRNLSEKTLEEAFTTKSKQFTVQTFLKENIHWLRHDLLADPPPTSQVDLIFLRNNLLTYHLPPMTLSTLSRILSILKTGGLLVIGLKENLPATELPLRQRQEHPCIYEKTSELYQNAAG